MTYATNLLEARRKLLENLEHTTRQIEGTMEVRKTMRFATHAGCISKVVPISVTFSPDEKHNVLMMRLSRSRANDPLRALDRDDKVDKFGGQEAQSSS